MACTHYKETCTPAKCLDCTSEPICDNAALCMDLFREDYASFMKTYVESQLHTLKKMNSNTRIKAQTLKEIGY